MAVTSCKIIWNNFRLVNRESIYTAKYRIISDTRNMSAYTVISQATSSTPDPFPAYFSTYNLLGESDPSAFLKEATCDPLDEENSTHFIGTAIWSPINGEEETDPHTSRENPLARPTIYWREWEEINVPVEKGWNNPALPGINRPADTLGPIQNAAGQEPSSPIIKSKRIPVMVAQKNYATLAQIDAIQQTFGDSVNDSTYANYPQGEACFRGITASRPQYEGGVRYYTGTIRVAFQKGGWDYEMVNRGWKYLLGGELREATVADQNGNQVPVAEPINLEIDGSRTPDGQIGTIINYRHRPRVDYNAMGV